MTLPLLSPVLLFLVVVLVIFGLQAFAQIEFLTGGGPAQSTETLVYKIFQRQTPDRLGEGSVMAVGLFAVTFVVTLGSVPDPRAAGALWPLTRRSTSSEARPPWKRRRRAVRRPGRPRDV